MITQARPFDRPLLVLGILAILALQAQAQGGHSIPGDLVAQGQVAINELRFDEALEKLDRAIELAGDDEDDLLLDRIDAHRLRSLVKEQLRELVAARKDAEMALRLSEKRADPENRARLIPFLRRLAELCAKTDQKVEAGKHYARALTIARAKRPKDLDLQLAILHPLARLQRQARELEAAIISLRSYVATIETARGELHADCSQPLWELALCLRMQGDADAAIPVLERWVLVFERARGEGDPSTARGVAAMVDCELALGRLDAAESQALRWLKLLEKVSKTHPDAVLVLDRLARIERERGRTSHEIAHLEEAVRRGQAVSYPDEVRNAELLRLLASARRRDGRLVEAAEAIDESMALAILHLPEGDPERQLVRLERGRVAEAGNNFEGARADYEAVLAAFEKLAGKSHPALLEPLRALAALARKQKRNEDAAALDQRIAAIETDSTRD